LKESLENKQEESLDDESSSLILYWDQPPTSFYSDSEGTLEYGRRKLSYDNDFIRTTPLASFVAARLQEAEVACGGAQVMRAEYIGKVDPTVLDRVMAEIFGN